MNKRLKTLSLALGMAAMSAVSSTSQAALTSGFDAINFDPAISNSTDYFGVYSSQTTAKHGWNAGFYLDYAKNPLEFGAPPGTRVGSVVDNMLVGNFYGTFGILSWFSVGLNIPVAIWNDVNPIVAINNGVDADFLNAQDTQTNMGDIRLEFKMRLRDNSDKLVGIALIPFVTGPSGPSSTFAGNGAITGGLKFVLDFNISDRVKLALNVGYLARDRARVLNVDFDDQLLLSLGLSVKIVDRLMFIMEAATEPVIRNFFDDEVHTPFEARGGFRIKLTERLNMNIGGGAGLTIGVGSPDYRAFLGLNYNWAPAPCSACEAPQVEARKITIDQTIHFDFDKSTIKPVSFPILDDVVAIIKGNMNSIKRVSIEGHTDAIGSDAYNQGLSDRRANSVKQYLINKGIPADMLDSTGYGESRPVDSNETEAGRAKNRRVEFQVN